MSTTLIPPDHLAAELSAALLGFEESLRFPATAYGEDYDKLWARIEPGLLATFPSYSVDEIEATRDAIWFRGPLCERVQEMARLFLDQSTGWPRVNSLAASRAPSFPSSANDHECLARKRWRWLAFALPPDLLMAALPATYEPQMISPLVKQLLSDRGFAELHLHMGASWDFSAYWSGLMHVLATCPGDKPELGDFESPGAPFDHGKDLGHWMVRCAAFRMILGEFLRRRAQQNPPLDFGGYLRRWIGRLSFPTDERLVEDGRGELTSGKLPVKDAYIRWRHLLHDQWGRHIPPLDVEQASTVYRSDPLHSLFPGFAPERLFISDAFEYMDRDHPEDREFAVLFWQVQRLRCIYYRYLNVRPMTPGLKWFVRFYNRIGRVKRVAGKQLPPSFFVRTALASSGEHHGLKSLEVRTSPGSDEKELRTLVDEVALVFEERKYYEIGLVLHFIKDRGLNWEKAHPSPFRYSGYYAKEYGKAHQIVRLLWQHPSVLTMLRGLDFCTDELGVPNWVLVPILRHVHQAARDAVVNGWSEFKIPLRELRTTVHAGEDFVHLLTGLRSISEPLDHIPMRSGDRIGHGLALGVNPVTWCERKPSLVMPREDRLLDLLWELSRYELGVAPAPAGRERSIESEIREHGRAMFGDDVTVDRLARFYSDIFRPGALRSFGYPHHLGPVPENSVLYTYLRSPIVFSRSKEPVRVETSAEMDAIMAVQNALRRKVGQLGITVEVNPTSNLLVGNLGDLGDHPLWRLRPVRPDPTRPPISVCLGSDDPILLGSNLPQEYQIVFDSIVNAGGSGEEARLWIERTREAGMEARFTIPLEELNEVKKLAARQTLSTRAFPARPGEPRPQPDTPIP